MNKLSQRVADLSPEKRALLTLQLKKKRAEEAKEQVIPRREDRDAFPLSFAQQRLWFLDQYEPDNPFYNIAAALRLTGPLDVVALERSLNEIVRRHEVLRAVFVTHKGHPVQIIAPKLNLTPAVVDLENLSGGEREAEALRLATAEARQSFDLTRGPLLRARLLRLGEEEHVALLTMHHIVSDGWSMGVLIREITTLYEAFSTGKPSRQAGRKQSPLPELPLQYADFAHWQRGWLQGEVLEKQLDYWRGQLGGDPLVLELPTDRSRPVIQTYCGAHHSFKLPRELSKALEALSRQQDVTLFVTLLAAFQTLLYRYTRQQDVSVGTPVANRNRAEVEGLIGFFVNTLVLRADLSGEPSFRELLGQMREATLEAQAHQDLPFEMLVDAVQPQRDLSHTPFFQVMFALENRSIEGFKLPSLNLSLIETHSGTSKFDLTLFMVEGADGLSGTLEYNTDLWDAPSIARMAEHFQTLLAGIVADPDRPVSTLTLVPEAERQQLLVEWNDTRTGYARDFSLQQLFEVQVERRPEAIVMVFDQAHVTFRELNRRANQLARHLQSLGVGPETLVGVYTERSLEMVVGLLGIVKAGAAYMPLDTGYPKERLAFMLQDGQVPVLLSQEHLVVGLPEHEAEVLCLDSDWDVVAQAGEENPVNQATADNLAYVIYTSGSTGIPKGVSIPQRAIVCLLFNTNYIELKPSHRIAQASNASFDAATFEIWGALLHGAQLIGVSKDVALSAHDFAVQIRDQGINVLFVTTALFNHIAATVPGAFNPLEHLMFGGEAVDPRWVREVLENDPPQRLLHVYGPTESTTFASWYLVQNVAQRARTIPIGRPLSNTQIYVLDDRLLPVPIGVPGQLCIGGDGLARDYLNRPRLTAEKFVPSPFSPTGGDERGGARLYLTGDLVRYLPDGSIEFLGRTDFQVKLRGFRIELGEIEAELGRHPAVREVLVMARGTERTSGDKRIVAYLVPHDEPSFTSSDLRSFLKERLPEYMVPSAFVVLDAFPLTPNGKVSRRALPLPDQGRPELEKAYVAPRTAVERFLTERLQQVLGIDRVGIYDNFFELGGDSLQAAVLVNRIQEELGVTAHVKALFMAPTVVELAPYLTEYYPDAVAKIAAGEPSEAVRFDFEREIGTLGQAEGVEAATVAQIRQLIPPLPPRQEHDGAKNPPAIFILSPPRSGSTLFRTMLAGHPRLFAPPELDLMSFNTLGERRAAFSGENSFWLEGPIHAIMDIQGCDVEQATRMMEGFENQNLSTKQFYGLLQEWLGAKSLVDKTPTYPLDMEILKRLEADFQDALYIHLVRHPYATVYSFVEAKLDQLFFRHEHPFSRRVLAELVWIISHQHILEFLRGVPAQRQFCVAYEDLVTQPEAVMKRVCQFLDIEFHPTLVRPYDGGRMTEGIRPGTQMVGDFKFYLRKEIDPGAADRWKKFHTVDFLSGVAWQVAESLGYERSSVSKSPALAQDASPLGIQPIPRDGDLPLSFSQQRLWFLDQFEPGSPFYNVPSAVRLTGPLHMAALERTLNEIVRRHEVLRTTFATTDGRARQIIAPELLLPLPVVDLVGLTATEREHKARRLATEEARRPFDLAHGPLVRACLLRLGQQEHVLFLTAHHIVSDGWSRGVLIQEMATLYETFSAGRPSRLPELPVQYADYAYWQRQWLQGEVLESQLSYWRQQLAGIPPMLELPTDRPRPAVQTLRGATLWFDLPQDLSEAIRVLSRKQGASLFMTLLAAFQALLYRYSGQEDISVGTPIANRNRAEIEGLIGFFANTLVLRTDLSGAPSFRELLERVRQVAVGAYANQDVPFEMLVDELQPERDMSHTPLFQVMFTIQDAPIQALKLPGITLSPLASDSDTAKFDLILSIVNRADKLRGSLEYNTDLFNADTIERMAGHYQALLEGIVADPDQPVSALPLLTGDERRQLLVEWNDSAADYPGEHSIPDLFEAQVTRTPDAPAVIFEGESLSYAELNRRANQLAHYMRKLGVGPETLVGLCVERSLATVLGVMGILKAGGAYLPLDPAYPPERLVFMLQDSQASVLLTQAQLLERLPIKQTNPPDGRTVVCLETDWDASPIAQESDENPDSGVGPDNLAYVIYTSGSTGRPKGAMIQHRSALHLAAALQRKIYAAYETPLRLGLNAPLPFDASVQQWLMLLYGHTLYVIPQPARLDGQALLAYLRRNRLQGLDCVPSQLKLLLAVGLLDGSGWTPSVVLPGGEAIDEATWRALSRAPQTEFYNMYGPTECTVDSTIARVRTAGAHPTIGGPVTNARLYVLDRHLQLVPVGVPGELHIGGAGVGRGYLNRPSLTAQKFIPDPFGGEPDARLYKTGDLARYLPDGNVEFLGRLDHQVKVRGFRIELGEIETALKEHPEVREAVTLVREDTPGDKRLVAYLVPENDTPPTVSELRRFLGEKLPDYMLPSAFVTLESLPLLPNAKVNRRALPAPDQTRPELESAFVAPRTRREEILAGIWTQVLGVEHIGVHDNFFELGGDSILSIQVIARANQAGLRLTPRQLFESPTVAGLAAVAGTGPVIQAEQDIVEGPLPLTPIQRRFFEQDLPEPQHWNQAVLLEVGQRLEAAALEGAVEHLLAHHDALRLRFTQTDSGWAQVNAGIEGDVPFGLSLRTKPFEWVDLSGLSEVEQKAAVEARAAELQASLSLATGPLLRVAYFDLGAGRTDRLLMVIHHLVIDGVSWRVLMEDLQTAYQQLDQGVAVRLPPKTTSFQYWARRLVEYAQSARAREELPYWLALIERNVVSLPVDYPGGANTEASARSVRVALSVEETQALLQAVPAAYGTEINDALLTALAQAMARLLPQELRSAGWTGGRTLLVDLEGHGREDILEDVDLSRTVGWFTTVYPLALDLTDAGGSGQALIAVKEQLRRVPNRGIGYGLLRYLGQDEQGIEELRALPQPQVSFNYLGQFGQALPETSPFGLASESKGPERSLRGKREHLLSISGSIVGGVLELEWGYSENLHRRTTIEGLAEDFVAALRAIIAHCQSPDASGYTPSDFADVELTQDDIEALLTEIGEAVGGD